MVSHLSANLLWPDSTEAGWRVFWTGLNSDSGIRWIEVVWIWQRMPSHQIGFLSLKRWLARNGLILQHDNSDTAQLP